MKNNIIKILILTAILTAVAHTGLCDSVGAVNLPPLPAVDPNTQTPNELTLAMIKFGKVMLGVVIASVVIYFLLLIWNAVVARSHTSKIVETSLRTPKNINDAIMLFINKNRLK